MGDFVNPFEKDDGFVNPFAPDYKAPSIGSEFKKAVRSGIEGTKQAGYGVISQIGDVAGLDRVRDYGLQGVLETGDKMQKELAPAVGRVEDVGGVHDAALYAAQGLGQLVPFAATSIAGGGVGGAVAKTVGRKAAQRVAEQAIARGVEKDAAAKLAEAAASKSVEHGAIAGAGATSIGTESGLIQGQTYEQTGKSAPGTALAYGVPAGLLDVLPEARVIHQALGGAVTKAGGKAIAKDIAKQTALEGSTEAAQTYIENKATEAVDPTESATSPENISQMVNAGVIGGLGGAVFGGAGHLAGRLRSRPAEINLRPQPDQIAGAPSELVPQPNAPESPVAGTLPPGPPPGGDARQQAFSQQQETPTSATEEWRTTNRFANLAVPPITDEAMNRLHAQAAADTKASLRPFDRPDAGPLTRVASLAVDNGLAVPPEPIAETHPERADVTQPPDLQLQNRDRSRPASIAQMQTMAANPDYDRLGTGKSPNEAAPMVSVGANAPTIPESDFGHSSRVVMADNSKIPVRYAVVEADSVLASHNADGSVNGDYFAQTQPGVIRALNNGRTAALQEAYRRGTAESYKAALVADAAQTGISPEAIAAKKNPVLVRVYDDAENVRPNIGALSNPQSHLKPSNTEQAQNDARSLDAAALIPDEHGGVMGPKNTTALKQFLAAIPAAEHNDLVGKNGYTKQFADRVQAALFAKAYGNPELVSLATEAADPEIKNVLHALTAAAPEFAKVQGGGHADIRPALIEAVNAIREGKSKGLKPAEIASQKEVFGREPMTQTLVSFIAKNTRAPSRMADAFSEAARFLQSETSASTSVDMFGKKAATMADLAARVNAYLEAQHGPETRLAAETQAGYAAAGQAEKPTERAPQAGSGGHAPPDAGVGKQAEKQGAAPRPVAFDYTANPALPAGDKAVESRFGAALKGQTTEQLATAYAGLKDSEGGKVLNTDTARELSYDYLKNRGLSNAVHEPASALIRALYTKKLAEKPKAGEIPLVMFTAGGTGAGKSTGIKKIGVLRDMKNKAQMVYDTNMSDLKSARQKIDQALAAGKKVSIVYTYRDPVEALVNGAIARAKHQAGTFGSGRGVSLAVHLETHAGSLKVIRELDKLYENNPNVGIWAVNNSLGKEGAKAVSLENLPEKIDNSIEGKLREALEAERTKGLDEGIYNAFAGKGAGPGTASVRGPGGEGHRGESQQRQAPDQHAVAQSTGKFELAGQTSTEAQVAAHKQAQSAADAKKREAAPSPAGFTLTGSDRKADLNPEQHGLFDAVEAFVNKALDALPKRADDTPKARTAREAALRELTQRGRINLLGATINLDMLKDGVSTLIGREVTGLEDLATIAQIYRDPRFETLRYVIVKGGKVVHETAVSSRLPSMVAAFSGNEKAFIGDLMSTVQRLGADGFYMLHNHPSGQAEPSGADKNLTRFVSEMVREIRAEKKIANGGLLGHVIIDTNEIGVIDSAGRNATVIQKDFGGVSPHRVEAERGMLGSEVRTPKDLARVAADIKHETSVGMIGSSGPTGKVVALGEIAAADLEGKSLLRVNAIVLRFARASGSGNGVYLTNIGPKGWDTAKELVRRGAVADALRYDGTSALAEVTRVRSLVQMGHQFAPIRIAREQGNLFADAEKVDAPRLARLKREAKPLADLFQSDLFGSSQVDISGKQADNGKQGAPQNESDRKVRGPGPQKPQGERPGDLFADGGERGVGAVPASAPQGGDLGGGRPVGQAAVEGQKPESGERVPGSGEPSDPGSSAVPVEGRRRVRPQAYQVPDRPGTNFRITRPDEIGTGGEKAKYRRNVDAIKLLKEIEADGRLATPDEQAALAQYVGWGGLKNAFFLGSHEEAQRGIDEPRSWYATRMEQGQSEEWAKERRELHKLLTPAEYDLARGSTPNAHYTAPQIINAIWDAVRAVGFEGGRILEPAMGVGHFFGLMPDAVGARSVLAGVELDSISGRISKQLYQKADVRVEGFEKAQFPAGFFDLAISNVPFGDYKVDDKKFNKFNLLIHDYFFAKALDRLRPGGMLAFITSDGTLDKLSSQARKVMSRDGEFVGAIRLPNDSFKKNAGTEVTTDIIFMRKRGAGPALTEPAWLGTGPLKVKDGEVRINEYFIAHPEMMMGRMSREGTMYGHNDAALVSDGRDLAASIREAIAKLPKAYEAVKTSPAFETPAPAPDELKPGALMVKNGRVFQKRDGMAQALNLPVPLVTKLIALRDAARTHLRNQVDGVDHSDSQNALNAAYDAFVKAHGYLNSKPVKSIIAEDSDAAFLLALEKWSPETGKASKADIFSQRTVSRFVPVETAETPLDALTVSLAERGHVDVERMAQISGLTPAEVIGGLEGRIYFDPVGREWQQAESYLAGNVRQKLRDAIEAAKSDPQFEPNVKALQAAMPADIPHERIRARLGQRWIPTGVIEGFGKHLLAAPDEWQRVDVAFSPTTSDWRVKTSGIPQNTPENTQLWGTPAVPFHKGLELALNQQKAKVFTEGPDDTRVVNVEATAAANEKIDAVRREFETWWRGEPERAQGLAKLYNEEFNNIRLRQYDGSHLKFPGINPIIGLRQNVKDGAWRIVSGGNTLLAHVVGAGKTFTAIAGSMENKRLGVWRKPMHIVLNSTLDQYANDWQKLYPNANLLIARKEDLAGDARKVFTAKVATGNWDGIVIAHSTFGKIGMSPEFQQGYVREQLRALEDAILEGKANQDDPRLLKQLEKRKKKLQAKLEGLLNDSTKDDVLRFEDLGVDAIVVDEAHKFKNLEFLSKMDRIAGMGGGESQRATDMLLKTRYINQIQNGKGGVVFMTGTPISNSVTEMYTMQRYLGAEALQASGLDHFDNWAAQFGEAVTNWEMTPDGGSYAPKTRFAKFVNVGELAQMFGEFADVKTAEMLKLPVPALEGGGATIITSPKTKAMGEFVDSLVARAERVKMRAVDPTIDNMLKITNDGKKAALDLRLVVPDVEDDPNSKVSKAAANIARIWKDGGGSRLVQLVFSDLSVSRPGVFNVYDDLKARLIKLGVAAKDIAFIQSATTDEKREQLFQAAREGKARIIFGSTEKLGTGVNVQNKLTAMHHLDVPWKPADVEQRNGRGIRQGNENETIGLYHYVTEGSFDAFMWETVDRKAGFIAQAMQADPSVREIEEVDNRPLTYAELKAVASGNPIIMEKAKVEGDLLRLTRSQSRHAEQQAALRAQADKFDGQARYFRMYAENAAKDEATLKDTRGKDFQAVIGERRYADRVEAANALAGAIGRAETRIGTRVETPTGEIAGFPFSIGRYKYAFGDKVDTFVVLHGRNTYSTELGESADGNLSRLENLAASIRGDAARASAQAQEAQRSADSARANVGKPFEQEAAINKLLARAQEIDRELGIGKDDESAVEGGKPTEAPRAEQQIAVYDNGEPTIAAQNIFAYGADHLSKQAIVDKWNDLTTKSTSFGFWARGPSTQLDKALSDRDFKPSYDAAQRFLNDVARIASTTADLSPDLLPKLEGWRGILKYTKAADIKAISEPLFRGTLVDEREYTAAELKTQFRLSDKQVSLYQQARATIGRSLELLAQSEIIRRARGVVDDAILDAAQKDTFHGAADTIKAELLRLSQTATDEPTRQATSALAGETMMKYGRVRELIREGYMPLMRFGQYTLDMLDRTGKRTYFAMFESQADANAMARSLRQEFGPEGARITLGTMPREAYKVFRGVTPDTLELFAEALGLNKSELFQEYYKRAVDNRSVLKRLIHRKETPGFDRDVQRILASFVTSNSRAAAANLHYQDMDRAVNAIPKEKGRVKDEAYKLVHYVKEPEDEAPVLRGFLFVNYLGGSIAAALVNLTQPVLMTMPRLAVYGAGLANKALLLGIKESIGKVVDADRAAALKRAEQEGVVSPHEIHQLYAESIRGLGQNVHLRKAIKVWGSLFSLAEQFNRRSTFLASFSMAQGEGLAEINAKQRALGKDEYADAFEFAKQMVAETQGVYNRGNRPNWGRGAIGATLLTFKQFTIAYLEFLKRLPPKERALALAVLGLASGVSGLPFSDDLDDLIDTIAQALGYNWNTKQAKRKFLVDTLGEGFGNFVNHGLSTLPGIPLDIQARLSVGNVIPGTGLLKRSEPDKTRDITEFLGPAGGLAKSAGTAFQQAQAGQVARAGTQFAPIAIQNVVKALDMLQSGYYRDAQGRRVAPTDTVDAITKGVGFQPSSVAARTRKAGEAQQNIDMVREVQGNITAQWAQGLFENRPTVVEDALADLREWNAKNPEAKIQIRPGDVARRVKEMSLTREQREIKNSPKAARQETAAALRER